MLGERSRYGLAVAAGGAVLLAASPFLPWYGVRHAAAPSGMRVLGGLGPLLLVLAGLALLDALLPLVRTRGTHVPAGAGASLVLLGAVASTCALFRIVDPPAGVRLATLSPREGAWLALAGAATVLVGGVWPRIAVVASEAAAPDDVWAALGRWTPQG